MIKIKSIDELKIGQNIYGFYQSIFKEKKISKNGDYYIDLLLKDRTGQINGKIWHFTNFYDSAFQEGDLVIDCGANLGDLYLYLTTLNIRINYFSHLLFFSNIQVFLRQHRPSPEDDAAPPPNLF